MAEPTPQTPVVDAGTAPQGGTNVNDFDKAQARIEGLLSLTEPTPPKPESTPESADTEPVEGEEEADIGPDQEEPAPDDTVDQDEPDDDHPALVEPPNGWPSDKKALFAELPDELKQVITQRESQRDRATYQKMEELAQQRKAVEAETARVNQEQQKYSTTLSQLLNLTMPELMAAENIPLSLAQEDPTEYVRRTAVRDSLRQRVQYMQQEQQRVEGERYNQFLGQHQEKLGHEWERLCTAVPEYNDPEKRQALITDIGQMMVSRYNFSIDEIASIADSRAIRALTRLAQLEKQESARKSGQAKKTSAGAPRLMGSNAAPSRDGANQKKYQEGLSRLRKTGDMRDAEALFTQLLR